MCYILDSRAFNILKIKYLSCVVGFKFKLLTNLMKIALGGKNKVLDDDSLAYFLSGRKIVRTLRSKIMTLKKEKKIEFSNHEDLETSLDTFYYGEKLSNRDQPYLRKTIRKLNNFEQKLLDLCYDSLFATDKSEPISQIL